MRKLAIVLILFSVLAVVLPAAQVPQEWSLVVRLNRAVDDIVPDDAKLEKLAGEFGFLEGPVWISKGRYLIFSDIPANVIRKWSPEDGKVSVFQKYTGFTGADSPHVGGQASNGRALSTQVGSNGITLDAQGRVVYCAHGDRQVVRLEESGPHAVLASEYDGKRLNSPNDLVYKSDGSLYFTDPPAGLRQGDKDPKKELPFDGGYRLANGKLQLLSRDFTRPNGLAFSPDEKYLYVNDTAKKTIMRF